MKKTLNSILSWNPKTEILIDSAGSTDVKSVRRDDNNELIGVVGSDRHVASNTSIVSNVVDICNRLNVNSDKVQAYEIHGGASLRFRIPIEPLSIGEENECFVSVSASHDSTVASSANMFIKRLVCENGMMAMVKSFGAFAKFCKNYEISWTERFDIFQDGLTEQRKKTESLYKALREKNVSPQKVRATLDKVFPGKGKRTENARSHVEELFISGKGNGGRTGADLLNGLTEYLNHERGFKETRKVSREENRFLAIEKIDFESLATVILK